MPGGGWRLGNSVNGVQAEPTTPVRDGDTVELMIQMVGG